MATFEMNFPEDFLGQLLNTDSDELCRTALEEAAPLLVESMKKGVEQGGHQRSGELIKSIKAKKPTKSRNGAWMVHVRPTGYSSVNSYSIKGRRSKRKYKVSNALKMIWIEYGINGRQPAKPFITKTVNEVQGASMRKLQEVYDQMAGV